MYYYIPSLFFSKCGANYISVPLFFLLYIPDNNTKNSSICHFSICCTPAWLLLLAGLYPTHLLISRQNTQWETSAPAVCHRHHDTRCIFLKNKQPMRLSFSFLWCDTFSDRTFLWIESCREAEAGRGGMPSWHQCGEAAASRR